MCQQATILVIDDDRPTQRLLDLTLSEEGYQVAVAASGPAALAQLAAAPVDLILCDYLMPDMDGVEFLHRYRRSLPPPHVPVVLLTAAAATPPDGVELIAKPFDLDDLLAVVARHVGPGCAAS